MWKPRPREKKGLAQAGNKDKTGTQTFLGTKPVLVNPAAPINWRGSPSLIKDA